MSTDSKTSTEIAEIPTINTGLYDQEYKTQINQIEIMKSLARIEQDTAIANRIRTSSEVEIEEYYSDDMKGQGKAGGSFTSVEVEGSYRRRHVRKRVYKFKDRNNIETSEQIIEADYKECD